MFQHLLLLLKNIIMVSSSALFIFYFPMFVFVFFFGYSLQFPNVQQNVFHIFFMFFLKYPNISVFLFTFTITRDFKTMSNFILKGCLSPFFCVEMKTNICTFYDFIGLSTVGFYQQPIVYLFNHNFSFNFNRKLLLYYNQL